MHISQGGRSPSLRVCPWGRKEGDVDPGWRGAGTGAGAEGGGPSLLEAVAVAPGRGGSPGPVRRQGTKGKLYGEGQEKAEVCLHLVPDGEDKGARGGAAAWTGPTLGGLNDDLSGSRPFHDLTLEPQASGSIGQGLQTARCQDDIVSGHGQEPMGDLGFSQAALENFPGTRTKPSY